MPTPLATIEGFLAHLTIVWYVPIVMIAGAMPIKWLHSHVVLAVIFNSVPR